ncbi:MAG: RNA polymerase-binding protein DksA [Gammaproteobacteria bacterium]
MPVKKAAKPGKPAKKAAPRKAAPARKAAKPARKPKVAAARARPTRPLKAKPQNVAPATPPRAMAKPSVAHEPAILKPRPATTIAQVAEGRPALAAIQLRPPARRPGGEEEEEGTGTHNLLLGPRNVLPYRERKGERYMSREQLEHFRVILNSWKRDLMEEVDRTMSHMKDEAANPPDPNDRATLESEFALELRTRDRERKLIRKIDEALSRIDDGSYGYCVETGEPIGVKRLEARPVATLCIEAQERRERREKQYGDRDDWYR